MRWEDERYVRLYTRDTITWKRLPWQSKALFPLLMRRADRAGNLEIEGSAVETVAVLTELPDEVVEVGLKGLLDRGVVALPDESRLLIPNFHAAQEARSTDAQRKRDERERVQARKLSPSITGPVSHTVADSVTSGHTTSDPVTKSHPSLASLASLPATTEDAPAVAAAPVRPAPDALPFDEPPPTPIRTPRARKAKAPPPEPSGFVEARDLLQAVFLEKRGHPYAFEGGKDGKALAELLKRGDASELERRWRLGLDRSRYPLVATLHDLATHWNALAGTGPPEAKNGNHRISLDNLEHDPVGVVHA